WDVEAIRREHLAFIDVWSDPSALEQASSALTVRTMLVADWLALLRADPRLPREFMDDGWPAAQSYELYWRRHNELAKPSAEEFAELVGVRPRTARRQRARVDQ